MNYEQQIRVRDRYIAVLESKYIGSLDVLDRDTELDKLCVFKKAIEDADKEGSK
jgi:hypothetical protein